MSKQDDPLVTRYVGIHMLHKALHKLQHGLRLLWYFLTDKPPLYLYSVLLAEGLNCGRMGACGSP